MNREFGVSVWSVVLLASSCYVRAGESKFTPLAFPQGNTESKTGLWLSADLGTKADILPLKTRIWATKESVTDGVALKCVFEPGSKASLNFEMEVAPPAGSAGLTFYAKASKPMKVKVCNKAEAEIGTDWKKVDLNWEALGTKKEAPNFGSYFVISVSEPVLEKCWLILDRIGTESPEFDPNPKITPQDGPDQKISSKDILYGTENLARTQQLARDKKPFTIYTFGDSIALGAQCSRGTKAVRLPEGQPFLYHNHLAHLWEEYFNYKGITVKVGGKAGDLKKWHLDNLGLFLAEATPNDLVIINLWGGTPAGWKENIRKLIATAKTKTDQIVIMSENTAGELLDKAGGINKAMRDLAQEDKVAAADITWFMLYRGAPYGWAGLGTEYHPTYELHIQMAEMMVPLLSGQELFWPK